MPSKKTKANRRNYERLRVDKNFFTERYSNDWNPGGLLRIKRVTLRSPSFEGSNFAMESVRIKTPEELAKIKLHLDYLAGRLGWKGLEEHIETLKEQLEKHAKLDPRALKLVEQYPDAVIEMIKTLDKILGKKELEIEDLPLIRRFTDTLLNALLGKKTLMIDLHLKLIKRVAKETEPRGITELLKLLREYELPQLTSVTQIITDRLQKLKVLEAQIQSELAYEIKGKNSIHNQLAEALWILDDRYWLLSSNKPLQHFLNKECEKKFGKERPDFVCADFENALVIVEIKRPSLEVKRNHVDQLEDYLIAAKAFQEYEEKKGFLIAKSISPRLREIVDNRPLIQFKSYTQVIRECRRRYKQYLDAVEKRKNFEP